MKGEDNNLKQNIKKKQVEVLGMENYNSQSKEHNKCDK